MSTKQQRPATDERFVVRMPSGMRDRIAITARTNERSINSEILHRLERWTELESELDRANKIIDRLLAQHLAKAEPTLDVRRV